MRLTGNRLDPGTLEKLLGPTNVEVADTDSLDEARVDELLHLLPGRQRVVRGLAIDNLLSIGIELSLACQRTISGDVRHEGEWPVHEEEVEVVEPKVLERVFDAELHLVVVQLKQLAGHKNFRTGHATQLDALADFALVLVRPGAVNVAIARLEGRAHSIADLARWRLPGTQTDAGNLLPIAEREVRRERHSRWRRRKGRGKGRLRLLVEGGNWTR